MKIKSKLLNLLEKFRFRNVSKPPYKHFVQIGDPILRVKCKPVEKSQLQEADFKKLLAHMKKAMNKFKCVGVSAPQLGVDLRVIAMTFPEVEDFSGSPQEYLVKQMQPYPLTVWINPTIKVLDYNKITFSEGCESMRGFSADVARFSRVRLMGWDENGEDKSEELSGWLARVAQHEMDHLDGRLYLDTAQLSSLTCYFWERVNSTGGNIHLSYYPNKFLSK